MVQNKSLVSITNQIKWSRVLHSIIPNQKAGGARRNEEAGVK